MEKGCGVMRTELSAGGIARFRKLAGNHSVEGDREPHGAGIPHGG
jgi:hypothetical protein